MFFLSFHHFSHLSGEDVSANPCPSTSALKRPPNLHILALDQPTNKRCAIEFANNETENSTRSPSISTTMVESNGRIGGAEDGEGKGRRVNVVVPTGTSELARQDVGQNGSDVPRKKSWFFLLF